jgi:mannose-6-phosphate isomerase-like protein (cupin superfamily)
MRYFKEIAKNLRKTTKGLYVNLLCKMELSIEQRQKKVKVEHQKLIVDGKSEDILHWHKRTSELFTVEEGNLKAFVNGKFVSLKKGDAILMEPGDKHKMVNPNFKPAKLIETRMNVCEGDRFSE